MEIKIYERIHNIKGLQATQGAGGQRADGDLLEATKEYAKELLSLARKELQPEKDLPRWKKCAPCDEDMATLPAWIVRFDAELAGESAVVHNDHYILFGDLEKLPKEE